MKKFFLTAGICTLSMFCCIDINAQQDQAQKYASTNIILPNNRNTRHYLNDINIKAVRDFKQRYKNVSGEIWDKNHLGEYSAYFISDGTTIRLYYSKHGKWYATLKTYPEDKLPFIIRDRIKKIYYDYAIGFTNEIITVGGDGLPTYIVEIKFNNDIKIIRIHDNEMEIWKQFKQA